jgi:hypothetical protein
MTGRDAYRERYDELLADTVRSLTRAWRLRWTVRDKNGRIANTGPADMAEFIARALAATAANVGGVHELLRGRQGSWEADYVRQLVAGTVGHVGEYLEEHRIPGTS